MRHALSIATISLLSLSQTALADDSGAYLGVGFSSNSLSSSCADGYFSSCNNPSTGPKDDGHVRLVGGYNFDRHFGFEVGFSDLGTYRVGDNSNATVGEFKASAITLALRGGNTFSNGFSIFGKLGLASVRTQYKVLPAWTLVGSTDQRSSGFVGGVAGQYDVNKVVGIRVSLEAIKFTDSEFSNVAGGIGLMAVFKL
ncbi:MAG: outer membrane beta-barrel protein [Pseudomonadota bacterium]